MGQTFGPGGVNNSYRVSLPGQEGPKLGLYTKEATQTSAIGQRMEFEDGRSFRYSHFVAACNRGVLVSQDVSVTVVSSIDGKFTDSAGTAKDDYATTDTIIYLTDTDTFGTADEANVYAGGYLQITDAAGEGYNYRIKSNGVGSALAAGVIKIELYDPLAAALDSETSASIIGNMWRNLLIATSGSDTLVSGVSVITATTANPYLWVQTWGIANVLCVETATVGVVAAGSIAVLSDTTAGAVETLGGGYSQASEALITSDFDFTPIITEPIVGYFADDAATTEHVPVFLQLQA